MKKVLACIGVILLFVLGIVLGMGVQEYLSKDKCKQEEKSSEEIAEECNCKDKKCIGNMVSYHIFDGHIPGTTYEVKLDLATKYVWVKESPGCSAEECNVHPSEYSTTLTDEEFEKVSKVLERIDFSTELKQVNLKSRLASTLYSIAADKNVFYSKEENEEMFNNHYKEYDDDNDGIVTRREFGNHYLNTTLETLDELEKES